MTALERKVARMTTRPIATARRGLVVSLEPGDMIAIRETGRRESSAVRESIATVFVWMTKRDIERKARERKQKKGGVK